MYVIRTVDRPTNHREFHIVKRAALARHSRLARHVPQGVLTRERDASAREKYAGHYTLIIVNHATTMAWAFDTERYASGFALARPTLEALLKQTQIAAYQGNDAGWQKIVNGNVKVNRHSLKGMATRTGLPDISQWWTGLDLAPVLNDFVHGGKGQVLSNPVDEHGRPAYPGDWFWTAMLVATLSMLTTSALFWAHMGNEERTRSALADLSAEDWGTIKMEHNSQTIQIVGPKP